MRRIPRWVWWVGLVNAFAVVAVALLFYGNDWWLSGLVTVAILAWLSGVLAAIYSPAEHRAPLVGALAGGFLYVLLALGPWFSTSVGPWLITTRALITIETKWLGREPQPPVPYQVVPAPYYTGGGSSSMWTTSGGGYILTQPSFYPGSNIPSPYAPVANGPSTFVSIGHWLFGLLAAAVSSLAAVWISRRSRERMAGENPFAEAAQQRPFAEAAQQRPFAEAAQQRPFAEAAQQRPFAEAAK